MKRILTILVLTFLLWNPLFPQQELLDSLKNTLHNANIDEEKIDIILEIVKITSNQEPDTAMKFAIWGLKLSEEIEYLDGIAMASMRLGNIHRWKSNYDLSKDYYSEALNIYKKQNDSIGVSGVYNNLGLVYKRTGNYQEALNYHLQSLRINEALGMLSYVAGDMNNIGIIYMHLDETDKALEYYKNSVELRIRIGEKRKTINPLINIGNILKDRQEYEEALEHYKEVEELLKEYPNIYKTILLSQNVGVVYEMQDKLDEAYRQYQKALTVSLQVDDKTAILLAKQGLGNVLVKSGQANRGLKYLFESLEIAEEIGSLHFAKDIYNNIYTAYLDELEDYENALQYFWQYFNLHDSIFNLEKSKQIAEIQEQYETEKKEQQIALLETENEVQQLDIARKRLIQYILIGAIVIALFLISYFWYANIQKKRKNRVLYEQNRQIINNRIFIARQKDELEKANNTKDRMFQIIAHDLRSPLISLDNFAKLIPFWVEEQDYEALQEMSIAIDSSVTRIISLIDNLLNWAMSQQGDLPYKPEPLNLKEIAEQVVELYSSFGRLKKLSIKSEIGKSIFVYADPNILSTVIRNLVNNSVKYTREGGEIVVGAEEKEGETTIWVSDDGIGIKDENIEKVFDIGNQGEFRNEYSKGLGLFFCREFVRMNRGEITVESSEGKGTTFYFTVPNYVKESLTV